MHFKQGSYPLRPPLHLSIHHNHSSLEESPILTQSPSASQSSPHYLYPESLERNYGVGVAVGLKQRIVGLLEKLRDWLQQLCLTETCMREVSEQLQPIIDEIKEAIEEESESCWFSLPQAMDHRQSRADSQKERNQSILIHEAGATNSEMWVVSEGEKGLLKVFFKKYCRLLENSLLRISKYSGQKKLRFLLDTNIRSIFTQTLRMSYDLKLIEFRLREHRNTRFANNKSAYVNLMATRMNMLLLERGGIKNAFSLLKEEWHQEARQDKEMVGEMVSRIGKLCRIYSRNSLRQLQSVTYRWRQSAFKLKIEEELFLVDTIRAKIYTMLTELVGLSESATEFRAQRQYAVESCLNDTCGQLFGQEDCFFMNLQDIMNERNTKREKMFTLADFLEQDSERLSSRRFLAQLTIEELRACILSGQIHKNEKSDHSLLLIPIKPASGIFFVKLESEALPSAEERTPMRLSSFRRLLRVVELVTPILEDLGAIFRRVQACWEETEKNEHYALLLKEFLKADLSKQEGHMQLECRPSEIEIDSHRLQSSLETAKDIMERCGISCLTVYHLGQRGINDSPCILYGNSQVAASQRFIIDSIYEQLVSSGKDLLVINRNGQLFNILAIWEKSVRVGLVSYITHQKVEAEVVSQCLVPLLLKCDGKLACNHCQVSLKTPQTESHLSQISVQSTVTPQLIDFQTASKLVACQNLIELQAECASILRGRGNFFFRMVFKVDLSDSQVFYSLKKGAMELLQLESNHKLTHQEMFIEDYTTLSYCSPFAKLAFDSPCFNNPQLYIYQNQNQYPLRFVAIPLKNSKHHFGYCLAAFYHSEEAISEQHTSFLQKMAQCISMNGWLFKPTKLNDERLQSYYRQEEKKQGMKIGKELLGKIKLPREGKLSSSLLDLSMSMKKYFNQSNNGRYQCNIKVFKLNLKDNKISIISSTNGIQGETKTDEGTFQKLTQNNAIYTHERHISSQCRLKKNDPSRTIKPLSVSNLNNIAIFWPELPEGAKSQLLEMVKERYELKGLFATQNMHFVQELNRKLSKQNIINKQYVMLKINSSLRLNVVYWVQFEHELVDNKDKNIINQYVVSQCLNMFNKVIQQSAQHQFKTKNRKLIMQFTQMVSRKSIIRQSVLSFHQNYQVSKDKIKLFFEKIERYIPNVVNNNIVHSRKLRMGFSELKAFNRNKLIRSSILIDRFVPVVERMMSQASKRHGLNAIYEFVQEKSKFSWHRSCNKIVLVIQQRMTEVLNGSFSAISHMSLVRLRNRMTDRSESAKKMHILISKIQRRQAYQHFLSQMHKVHRDYINSFDLIVQEFNSLSFSSRESFTLFANQRFDAVLAHSCYGSVERVQIGVCQISQTNMIIYRLNGQGQFTEVLQQRPISLQPQRNSNFNFLPVGASSCNFIIYKIWLKQNCKEGMEAVVIRNCIINGMLPCYLRYLKSQFQRTEKLADLLLRITCKEMWNASLDETQAIYAFGKANNYEEQSDKVRAFTAIKHFRHRQLIRELKAVRSAISEETKQYYRLEYEYNAISNAINCGLPNQLRTDEAQIFNRYEEFISKDKLKVQREITEKLESEYEKKNLQYQIKSKTFATSKILIYCDRKEKESIEGTSMSLLMREQDQNSNKNGIQIERAIVDGKMRLSKNADKHRELKSKKKSMSARSMLLLFGNISKANLETSKKLAFMTMAWPMGGRIRA